MNILEKLNAIKNQEITAKENVEAYRLPQRKMLKLILK